LAIGKQPPAINKVVIPSCQARNLLFFYLAFISENLRRMRFSIMAITAIMAILAICSTRVASPWFPATALP
jgi:hypothetical protein